MHSFPPSSSLWNRRSWIKTFAVVGAASCFRKEGLRGVLESESWSADSIFPVGTFELNLQDYPELLSDNGSIYFSIPAVPDIIVTRLPGAVFYAVTSVCTHQGCTVGTYDPSAGMLICPCHRSRFKADGTLIGGFAQTSLLRFPTIFKAPNTLTIQVSKYGFLVHGIRLLKTKDGHLRAALTFDADFGYRYEIRFQAASDGNLTDSIPVPYAETLDGAMRTDLFLGNGKSVTFYVDVTQSVGYFAVARYKLLIG